MRAGKKSEQAVLAAAVEWLEHGFAGETNVKLAEAIKKYKETQQAIANLHGGAESATDIGAWTCPHCGAERPAYGWHYNLGDAGPFALQWVTCFCGECKNVISTTVVAFMPKPELAEQLKKQFAGKLHLA
jgi:hypothetical protein